MTVEQIEKGLTGTAKRASIKLYDTLKSTNKTAAALALRGAREFTVVIAEGQTMGVGRCGKSFFSPAKTGLYMSIVLRPSQSAADCVLLTAAAAVAVAEAVEAATGKSAEIKWVNDIYVGARKVCGILTTGAVSGDTGKLRYAVTGIGINVLPPKGGFPADLQDTAAAVAQEGDELFALIAAGVLNRFAEYYDRLDERTFFNEYKRRMFILGKNITVIKNGVGKAAVALDINERCQLLVRYENGDVEVLDSGEISVGLNIRQGR